MKMWLGGLALSLGMLGTNALAENAAKPQGEPGVDPPTMHSLGVNWLVGGDENKNASVGFAFRIKGETEWRETLPLFRAESLAQQKTVFPLKGKIPDNASMFAGSALLLKPDTEYELRLKLTDPDGGNVEKLLSARTSKEPTTDGLNLTVKHVAPGKGGGDGTADHPYLGLGAAQQAAKPGTLYLLAAGVYNEAVDIRNSGETGQPIVYRGPDTGEALIDPPQEKGSRPGRGISAAGVHDVWFEKLSVKNAIHAIVVNGSQRMVVRRCKITDCDFGITGNSDHSGGNQQGFFFCDNTIIGPCTWPRTKGIESPRGIQVCGSGHEVCYNHISNFSDAIDTFQATVCHSIDFHHNDLSSCTDDGIEMDYSERNTRCFYNRFTNIYQGISLQPIYGGPTYIFRNTLYNVCVEPFKLHNISYGGFIFHNSIVKKGVLWTMQTSEPLYRTTSRNNLFIGTEGRAVNFDSPIHECDFDYDGFGGFSGEVFVKWDGKKYASPKELRDKASIYHHINVIDPATCFASGMKPPSETDKVIASDTQDFRLNPAGNAIDTGVILPGINDGFKGKAPDLGAIEQGEEAPWYGPRPEKSAK